MAAESLSPKNFVRILVMIASVIAKQGGQVVVLPESLVLLQKRALRIKSRTSKSIVFTLVPHTVALSATQYTDRVAYRADMVMRHLVAHSPGECLTITNDDIRSLGKFYLNFNENLGGIVAIVSQNALSTPTRPADRMFDVENGVATLVPFDGRVLDKTH